MKRLQRQIQLDEKDVLILLSGTEMLKKTISNLKQKDATGSFFQQAAQL